MFTIPKWIVYGIVLPTLFRAIYRQFVQQFRQERSSLRHYPIALLICLGCHPKNDHPGLQSCISLEKTQDTKNAALLSLVYQFIPSSLCSSHSRDKLGCWRLGSLLQIVHGVLVLSWEQSEQFSSGPNRPGKLVDHMALVKSRGHPQIIHFMFGFPFETVQLLGFLYFYETFKFYIWSYLFLLSITWYNMFSRHSAAWHPPLVFCACCDKDSHAKLIQLTHTHRERERMHLGCCQPGSINEGWFVFATK